MSRVAQTFRQSDVVRAVKALRAAGEAVARVEIDRDGKIVVIVGDPAKPTSSGPDEVDRYFERLNEQESSK
jgi:hypothetical protein